MTEEDRRSSSPRSHQLHPLAERLIKAAYRTARGAIIVTVGALGLVVLYPRSWVHVSNAGLSMGEFLWQTGRDVFVVVIVAAFVGYSLGLRSPIRIKTLYEAGYVSKSDVSFNALAWFVLGIGVAVTLARLLFST